VFVYHGFAPMIAARIKPQTAQGVQRVIAFVLLPSACRLHGTVWPCCSERYRVDTRVADVRVLVGSESDQAELCARKLLAETTETSAYRAYSAAPADSVLAK
jgi:hypothetical protein